MVETGTVWRLEVTSSTILYVDEIRHRIREALLNDPEIERIHLDELYEPLKLFANEYDVSDDLVLGGPDEEWEELQTFDTKVNEA